MIHTEKINVFYHEKKVGTIALYHGRYGAFAYDREWLMDGFSISPFSLPLEERVFVPRMEPFDGLFGVFADSLPDGWGRLLVDRLMLKNHMNPHEIGNLNRLAIVGDSGMGALTYEPAYSLKEEASAGDLDKIAGECRRMLQTDTCEDLDELFRLGGSSGGARPKILVIVDGEEWIIKFPSSSDPEDVGLEEYEYSLCAKACGLEMEETRLFPSKECRGYFGTRRYDRREGKHGKEKVHMLSASALLETSHRIPNLDYDILMKLTLELTREFTEVEKMYRLMCFNVFAHNRDDHSKNFTYLYEETEDRWVLAPAYDLTYSYSLGGEHATTVHGNGRNPGLADLLQVGEGIGIENRKARSIALDVKECVESCLKKYLR